VNATKKNGADFPVIAGRIVKLTTVQRQRIFDRNRGGLIDEPITLESSPASFFVLVLDGHKLLYVKEEAESPGIEAFGNTAARFLSDSYDEYIDDQFRTLNAVRTKGQPRITKKSLQEETPPPVLHVVEISTRQNLTDFLESFGKSKRAKMQLFPTNDEADNDPFIAELRRRQAAINAKITTFLQSNPDGMDSKEVIEQFAMTVDGNAKVEFSGVDHDDHQLSGNNQRFKLKIGLNVDSLGQDVSSEAKELVEVYHGLVEAGDVVPGLTSESNRAKLHMLAKTLFGD
jgi:hypothetical protein